MKRRIAALIRRYGSSVQAVFPDRTEIVRAFLQPVTSRSWQNMDHMIPTGGEVPRGQFLYIGPPELDIRGAEHLYLAGDRKSTRLNSSHRSLSRMPSSA